MQADLAALKILLDALNVPAGISTLSDRKRVQKAVYLGQLSGVDLGYRFGWYILGPYSPPLARDYFQLADELEEEGDEAEELPNPKGVISRLSQVRPLLDAPPGVDLPQEDWLELLASYDYLRRVSHFDHGKAVALLQKQKPHVSAHVDDAVEALRSSGLKLTYSL